MNRFIYRELLWALLLSFVPAFLFPSISLPQSPEEAKKLFGYCKQLYKQGRYSEAISIAEKVLAMDEKSFGSDHPEVAVSLSNLAVLYYNLGDYRKAEPLYKRALAINQKSFGPDHRHTATVLSNLAMLYHMVGDYPKAEPLYKRTLAIREKALGPDHPDTAISLNNLAEFYKTMGDYGKAEPFYKRALAINQKSFGPDHPDTAISLNNLAEFYKTMGDYGKAEPFYKRALAIFQKALGPDHPTTAISLSYVAVFYKEMGDYGKAEPLYKRCLATFEKSFGPNHPSTATALNNLAALYRTTGDYGKAEPLYKRTLAIWEKALGPDHPDTATALNNLAALYRTTGDYGKAEPLYKRTLAINQKSFGPDHPRIAASLANLAVFYFITGRYADAFSLMLRSQAVDIGIIDQIMGFTSESQKMKFLATQEWDLYVFLTMAQYMKDKRTIAEKALSVWLQRKGVVLEAQKRFWDTLTLADNPRIAEKFEELTRMRAQLSKLTFSGPGKEGFDAYRKKVVELEAQKESLEAQLSRMSDAFARKRREAKADAKQVAQALPKGSALVDFVRFPMFNFAAKSKEKEWLPLRYYVFILPSGQPDSISFIDLGDAGEIDRLVSGFKKNVTNYQGDPQGKEASRISQKLYSIVFEPIKKRLKNTKEIYVSPDGNLNLIPFEVLKGSDNRYLIEDYTFNYLGSGRDILGFGMVQGTPSKSLVIGDPDYDLDETGIESSLRSLGITPEKRSAVNRSRDMSSMIFPPLPGTKEEVESIASLLGKAQTFLYTGKDALEEVLMGYKTPKVLHLATHGFFLSDENFLQEKHRTRYENPLVRSGIVLAGANRSMRTGSDEGLVTAEKILSLRLRGTELVVLSACETGLGDIKSGEGVFGLRRAFIQAGTKGIVMSMWSVPDRETKELMINFYANVFQKKMKRQEALRQAVLTEISRVKRRYGHTNPLFWGAFVYLGEP